MTIPLAFALPPARAGAREAAQGGARELVAVDNIMPDDRVQSMAPSRRAD